MSVSHYLADTGMPYVVVRYVSGRADWWSVSCNPCGRDKLCPYLPLLNLNFGCDMFLMNYDFSGNELKFNQNIVYGCVYKPFKHLNSFP